MVRLQELADSAGEVSCLEGLLIKKKQLSDLMGSKCRELWSGPVF